MLNSQSIADRAAPAPAAGSSVTCARSYRVTTYPQDAAGRPALEAFIQQGFASRHGAAVRSFMPLLVGLHDEQGQIVGAAGYRLADDGRLFLEQYLQEPIERGVARRFPLAAASRSGIAEIGNFACRDCTAAMSMVDALMDLLRSRSVEWAVFTATRTVRGIMRHLGIPLCELARAEKFRIAVSGDEWGRYYETDPRVMLGHVSVSRRLRNFSRSA